MHALVGYFDAPEQTTPVYDPGVDGTACIVCTQPLTRPVVTISLMWEDRAGGLCVFFRACRDCWDDLSEDEQAIYEGTVLDDLTANGTSRKEGGT